MIYHIWLYNIISWWPVTGDNIPAHPYESWGFIEDEANVGDMSAEHSIKLETWDGAMDGSPRDRHWCKF